MSIELVGVLNVTPDSFSDGGLYLDPEKAAAHAEELFSSGASIVDIGGAATNPWAEQISAEEELDRIEALVAKLIPNRPDYSYSIDTYRPEVVERLAQYGKFIVNDVTTFINPEMIAVTAKYGLQAIASHLPLAARGDIEFGHTLAMNDNVTVKDELLAQRKKMIAGGIARSDIILDPGLGFGKSMQENWGLLELLYSVPSQEVSAWMIGPSQKRFLEFDEEGISKPGADKYSDALNIEVVQKIIKPHRDKRVRLLIRVHKPELYRDLLPVDMTKVT